MLDRHQLEQQAPRQCHHHAAGDRDGHDQREVPVVPSLRRSRDDETTAVDERRDEDDARKAELVAEAAGDERRDHIAGRDGAQQCRRDLLRLVQTVDDVEDDERPRGGKRPLPRCVREQEPPHLGFVAEDAPASPEIRANAFEDPPVAAVLADERDRGAARRRGDQCGEHERRRAPELEQEAAADERQSERCAAEDVLDALGAAEHRLRQEIGIQPAVRRLVHVVREEEREDDQRRRPEVRHERHQQQAEPERPERGEHERAAAAERRVERVTPRPDHRREREREDAFGAEHEPDQRAGLGESAEQRREVRRGRGDREGQPERAEAERPEHRAPDGRRARRLSRRQLGHQTVAAARSGARPPQTISTTVRSAAATCSSPSSSVPRTHPVSTSSSAP